MRRLTRFITPFMSVMLLIVTVSADSQFENLSPDQQIADFSVRYVYESETGDAMGARFRHAPSGFILDLLRIQSIPQTFFWINTPPPSDQGEPHTCEHLVLSKGRTGRYVRSLQDMSLCKSSAFTGQLQTCYTFHTTAGHETFYTLFEEKLNALIHPDFLDEEIRREVCNMGYSYDPVDSTIRLEEKGSIYNEMTSAYERPWSNLFRKLDLLLWGPKHPLSLNSGGYPPAVRNMTAVDMWKFHGVTHHINNMGAIVTIPEEISIASCLEEISGILKRIEPDIVPGDDPATLYRRLPQPHSSPAGIIEITNFPNKNADDPGPLIFAWPPARDFDWNENYLLELLVNNICRGSSSNLYLRFIDSQTRTIDVGANSTFGWVSDDPGLPVYIGMGNVKPEFLNEAMIDSLRTIVLEEINKVATMTDGSEELNKFNDRVLNQIASSRRGLSEFLNTPPGFGFRGTGGAWLGHIQTIERDEGFRRNLSLKSRLDNAEQLLSSGKNIWQDLINKWMLVKTTPYALAAKPDPDLLEQSEQDRKERIAAFVDKLKSKYGTDNDEEAKRLFKKEYDTKTAEIEEYAKDVEMPGFVNNPPLTLDDHLQYSLHKMPGGGNLVFSKFDNLTSGTIGFAFRLDVLPEELLPYAAVLPTLLTEVGVIKDGTPIPYADMSESVRRDITGLRAYFSTNNRTQRAELVFRASGSDPEETAQALEWMQLVMFDPYWHTDNLPRIRDAVDITLSNFRNRMRGSEESWVQNPSEAYRMQNNPLLLSANSFLTRTHFLHRMRWLFKKASSEEVADEFSSFMNSIATFGVGAEKNRRQQLLTLASPEMDMGNITDSKVLTIAKQYEGMSEEARELAAEALEDLERSRSDIPDESLGKDWRYLCNQMITDLQTPPVEVLDNFERVRELLLHADNFRAFLISSDATRESLLPDVISLADRFNKTSSITQQYSTQPLVNTRLGGRLGQQTDPVFTGLVNENTRAGVFVNTSQCASFADSDPEKLVKFLSARLYGGWGAHSMYMKTWSAGLAYSNGLRHDEYTGRLLYYAERCPDLVQTMQFVINELNNAPYDPSLADYAVAQAFSISRAASEYETRGEAMAADLADGLTAEVVSRFRQGILELRQMPDLYDRIQSKMEDTYGEVLPGYGPSVSGFDHASHFVIGPKSQLDTYEEYLKAVEGDATLHRLYPRDFWIVKPEN